MSQDSSSNITALIEDWGAGQPDALNRLLEAAYLDLSDTGGAYGWRSTKTGRQFGAIGNRPNKTVFQPYLRLIP